MSEKRNERVAVMRRKMTTDAACLRGAFFLRLGRQLEGQTVFGRA